MYEQVIRDIISRCLSKYGHVPSKVAVNQNFLSALRMEIGDIDLRTNRDVLFGGVTRVYVSACTFPYNTMGPQVLAWEVSLGQR